MKPDKIVCQNCGKQIDKGKWCSDKCRMAYKRKQPEQAVEQKAPEHEHEAEQVLPEQQGEQTFRDSLTKTDKTFYDRAMRDFGEPYYKFGETSREAVCNQCGAHFKTTLSLLKYCSYEHHHASLQAAR